MLPVYSKKARLVAGVSSLVNIIVSGHRKKVWRVVVVKNCRKNYVCEDLNVLVGVLAATKVLSVFSMREGLVSYAC